MAQQVGEDRLGLEKAVAHSKREPVSSQASAQYG
jgi:hypothetical protein